MEKDLKIIETATWTLRAVILSLSHTTHQLIEYMYHEVTIHWTQHVLNPTPYLGTDWAEKEDWVRAGPCAIEVLDLYIRSNWVLKAV